MTDSTSNDAAEVQPRTVDRQSPERVGEEIDLQRKPGNDIIDIERSKIPDSAQPKSAGASSQLGTTKHAHGKGKEMLLIPPKGSTIT